MKKNPTQYWLVRFAPRRTNWDEIVARGLFTPRAIKNNLSRKNLMLMQVGDQVLFYQTEVAQGIVGLMLVARIAYSDPVSVDPKWLTCDFSPDRTFTTNVNLATLRDNKLLAQSNVLKQPRIAVLQISKAMFDEVLLLEEK